MMGQRMGSRVRERWESAGSLSDKWGGGRKSRQREAGRRAVRRRLQRYQFRTVGFLRDNTGSPNYSRRELSAGKVIKRP